MRDSIYMDLSQGIQPSFTKLFNQLYKPLSFFAKTLISNNAAAEDIVTETFVQLWKRKDNISEIKDIKGYMFISVKNGCFNHLRINKKTTLVDLSGLDGNIESLIQNVTNEQEIVSELMSELIKNECKNLPPQYKKVLQMYYVENLSTQEISIKLNIATQTTRNLKTKGLAYLKKAVSSKLHTLLFITLSTNLCD